MRILIILFFAILSYLLVFLPGFFLFLPEKTNFFSEKKVTPSQIKDKTEKLPLKNPGEPPPHK